MANTFKGTVTKGLGKGSFFVSQEYYAQAFREKFGFTPFPGTLNLLLGKIPDFGRFRRITIPGRPQGQDTHSRGSVDCYHASIQGIPSALIRPHKSIHPEVIIELIAPVDLKNELDLKDGDEVTVELG
ncbi:CTP-dependent riboflavin kinase [Candidatus Woesearchaeota archaeon]|nr:CTP-dependent riboflavin kinase [Candidatus Woesearchaeota archaeon]